MERVRVFGLVAMILVGCKGGDQPATTKAATAAVLPKVDKGCDLDWRRDDAGTTFFACKIIDGEKCKECKGTVESKPNGPDIFHCVCVPR